MLHWINHQFAELNVVAIIIIFTFVTAMSKTNSIKLLKEQSQEIYNQFEEVKDEIREHHANITALINTAAKK